MRTTDDIKRLQWLHGLVPDGIVGPLTARALANVPPQHEPPEPPEPSYSIGMCWDCYGCERCMPGGD